MTVCVCAHAGVLVADAVLTGNGVKVEESDGVSVGIGVKFAVAVGVCVTGSV